MKTTILTTHRPEVPIEVEDSELLDLDRRGYVLEILSKSKKAKATKTPKPKAAPAVPELGTTEEPPGAPAISDASVELAEDDPEGSAE